MESSLQEPRRLSGRSRSLAAIAGETLDRLPNYTPTVACETASRMLGRPVHTGTGSLWRAEAEALLKGDQAFADFEAAVDDDLLALARLMQADVIRHGWRMSRKPTKKLDENTFLYGDPDGIWERWNYDPASGNYGVIETNAPVVEPEDWPERARQAAAALEKNVEATRRTFGCWEAAMQKRVGDEFLVLGVGGGFSVGVTEAALMACLLEPGAVADLLDCQLEIAKAAVDAAVERGIAVVLGGGDMADNNGTMYSPELFRELMLPRLKAFTRYSRERGVHYMWRSDGKVWDIADDLFVDAGIPGYGEIDFLATMTSAELRRRYPELVLWGNVAGDVLCRGTVEMVRQHVQEVLQGGGNTRHFFGCSNTILAGTPLENVQAFLETAASWRLNG